MTKLRQLLSALIVFICLSCLSAAGADIDRMQGKWIVKKKNDQGVEYNQQIEIKDSSFVFTVMGLDGSVLMYAKGDVVTEKAGNLKVVKFAKIQAGSSASNLEPIYDDRTGIYRLGYNTFTVAMNFDGYRDEDPNIEVYKKLKE